MRIRLRGPSGASTLSLGDDATVADLRRLITQNTALSRFDIKYGYPPRPLLLLGSDADSLSSLDVRLDGEQLIVSAQVGPSGKGVQESLTAIAAESPQKMIRSTSSGEGTQPTSSAQVSFAGMSGKSSSTASRNPQKPSSTPVSLRRKGRELEVPELPLLDRGATMVLRVMPDDNSCLFRAFGTAVLPGDDLSMTELRSLVASAIQGQPQIYTQVVLEQRPDEYCKWIQTEEAWGGAIEMTILSQHFDIEVCSIDVQSLRIDRFNEGKPTRCILVYSGIHYDTIVQSPSEPPHTKADNPPELDKRVWESSDEDILIRAQELCKKLQAQHYYTDTGGMAIKCNECGWIGYGEGQAASHAQQMNHYDMAEMGK